MGTFSKVKKYSKSSSHLDEKIEKLHVEMQKTVLREAPTNNTFQVYLKEPEYSFVDSVAPDPTLNFTTDDPAQSGTDTSGIFDEYGNSILIDPPGTWEIPAGPTSDPSHSLGPMVSYYDNAANMTYLGYVRQSDRSMINLGRITGQLNNWDQSSNFISYGQLTLAQAQWYYGEYIANKVQNFRVFYAGKSDPTDPYNRINVKVINTPKADGTNPWVIKTSNPVPADTPITIKFYLDNNSYYTGSREPIFYDSNGSPPAGLTVYDTVDFTLPGGQQFVLQQGGNSGSLNIGSIGLKWGYVQGIWGHAEPDGDENGAGNGDDYFNWEICINGTCYPIPGYRIGIGAAIGIPGGFGGWSLGNPNSKGGSGLPVNKTINVPPQMSGFDPNLVPGSALPKKISDDLYGILYGVMPKLNPLMVGLSALRTGIQNFIKTPQFNAATSEATGFFKSLSNEFAQRMVTDKAFVQAGKDISKLGWKTWVPGFDVIPQQLRAAGTTSLRVGGQWDIFRGTAGYATLGKGMDQAAQLAIKAPTPAAKSAILATEKLTRVVPYVQAITATADVTSRIAKKDYIGAGMGALTAIPGPIGWSALALQMGYDAAGGPNAKASYAGPKGFPAATDKGSSTKSQSIGTGSGGLDKYASTRKEEYLFENKLSEQDRNDYQNKVLLLGMTIRGYQLKGFTFDKEEKKSINKLLNNSFDLTKKDVDVLLKFALKISNHELSKNKTIKESFVPSTSTKKIIKEIKKSYQLPEEKKEKIKHRPRVIGAPPRSVGADMMKKAEVPTPFKSIKETVWGKHERQQNSRMSQERKNQILDFIGTSDHAWEWITETIRKRGNEVAYENFSLKDVKELNGDILYTLKDENGNNHYKLQSELNDEIYRSFFGKHLNEQETVQANKDPLFRKVKNKLNSVIDYPDKPSKLGYPDVPPPETINGWHPEYGQKSDYYKKLDPQSADTMSRAPTNDVNIDNNVMQARIQSKMLEVQAKKEKAKTLKKALGKKA